MGALQKAVALLPLMRGFLPFEKLKQTEIVPSHLLGYVAHSAKQTPYRNLIKMEKNRGRSPYLEIFQSPSTSSLCSPNNGALFTIFAGVFDSFTGDPRVFMSPTFE